MDFSKTLRREVGWFPGASVCVEVYMYFSLTTSNNDSVPSVFSPKLRISLSCRLYGLASRPRAMASEVVNWRKGTFNLATLLCWPAICWRL